MRDPITWQVRKINTLGPTGPARNVGGKLFRSVTVKLSKNWRTARVEEVKPSWVISKVWNAVFYIVYPKNLILPQKSKLELKIGWTCFSLAHILFHWGKVFLCSFGYFSKKVAFYPFEMTHEGSNCNNTEQSEQPILSEQSEQLISSEQHEYRTRKFLKIFKQDEQFGLW